MLKRYKKTALLFGSIFTLLLTGCANKNKIEFNDQYNLCIKNGMPLPFWTCKKNIVTYDNKHILISFSTYTFNSIEDELNKEKRKEVLQESVNLLLKKYKKFFMKYLNISSKNYNNYKHKIYNLLVNNVTKIAFIDKIFVPFEQSTMRVNSYVLVAYNKKKLFNLLSQLKNNKQNINKYYKNYYQ